MSLGAAPGTNPIDREVTRDDIEAKFKELAGEVTETTSNARGPLIAAGAAVAVGVVVAVFLLGRRRGRKRTTIVEIKRV